MDYFLVNVNNCMGRGQGGAGPMKTEAAVPRARVGCYKQTNKQHETAKNKIRRAYRASSDRQTNNTRQQRTRLLGSIELVLTGKPFDATDKQHETSKNKMRRVYRASSDRQTNNTRQQRTRLSGSIELVLTGKQFDATDKQHETAKNKIRRVYRASSDRLMSSPTADIHASQAVGGDVGGTVANESALRSAGTLISRVQARHRRPSLTECKKAWDHIVDWL
ncbi:hypothetical protein PoB_003169000 [Plakobranchus ocellatus]|uniref:Uncharacterized protein n=1 Tax=Plakobranchus ocellatus TaxID=259542 RepID=A0AAV4AAI3_9GAST|nr:hypothetical protein PoB_003169000 [Plakobranchus ocellatus]